MTFGSISLATAGLLVREAVRTDLGHAALLPSLLIVVGAIIAIASALPQTFHVRGHEFSGWKPHIVDNDSLVEVYTSQAEENDHRIIQNMESLQNSAKTFMFGVCITSGSIFLTITVLLVGDSIK